MNYWFRYEVNYGRIYLHHFLVTKITPKGVRLENGRFILLSAHKRFACPTVEEARLSFIARKKRQLEILNSQLRSTNSALKLIQISAPKSPGDSIILEGFDLQLDSQETLS